MRARLEEAFGVRPYNFYATTEGLYGHECPEGSMHLFDDMCIVENVDEEDRPVPAGEVGARLLVTNLFNHALPLIRFEVSDLVAARAGALSLRQEPDARALARGPSRGGAGRSAA